MTRIRLNNVSKQFAPTTNKANSEVIEAVRKLSLEIQSGEFFTFVGPSGCGKSTALNLIAGLEHASSGEILFDDNSVSQLEPKKRDVAMVFQSYALYPHLTVFDNIAFPLQLRKVAKPEQRSAVGAIASKLGLENLLERKPKELSGGQRQRVALARALIRRPRVFLMDEPLSNLDARLRLEMRAVIRRIFLEEMITTVYVTHDQEEAMVLSDRLAIMRDGEIEQCGTPLDMYENPRTQFVAEFIGNPPVNMLKADIAARLFPALISRIGDSKSSVNAAIRPNLLTAVKAPASGKSSSDTAVAKLIEMTGPDCWVHLDYEGVIIRARVPSGADISAGEHVHLEYSLDDFIFFENASGLRVELTAVEN